MEHKISDDWADFLFAQRYGCVYKCPSAAHGYRTGKSPEDHDNGSGGRMLCH